MAQYTIAEVRAFGRAAGFRAGGARETLSRLGALNETVLLKRACLVDESALALGRARKRLSRGLVSVSPPRIGWLTPAPRGLRRL
jgi:hypothetical protein